MYDYVIVGAGSAGCVLANRLTEDPDTTVLLLEAGGPDRKLEISIPAAHPSLMRSQVDWSYETEAQAQLNHRRIHWPRGKVLGGSSSINAMIYTRGNHYDYDSWHATGNPGWSFSEVLPYFKKAENQERGASEYHSVGGPLNVADPPFPNPLSRAFIEAGVEVGLNRTDDFNGPDQEGIGFFQLTQKQRKRHSVATAYLKPISARPNLTVQTQAHVTHLLFENLCVVGLTYIQDGKVEYAHVNREVILCGGVINSPQLLLLSGIGPADSLKALGIPVIANLPGVGHNLQDHLISAVAYNCPQPVSLAGLKTMRNMLTYMLFKQGPLTSNIGEAGAFLRTQPDLPAPDLEILFSPILFLPTFTEPPEEHGFVMFCLLLHPQSRGYVSLRSTNPLDPPILQPNYLESPRDLELLIEGVKRMRRLVHTKALEPFRGPEFFPGSQVLSDEAIAESIRSTSGTLFHPVGTCKMGNDPLAVVDAQLRVHGIEGIRVVDASIMPTVPGGHTNAPTIMIAEKAADLIKGKKELSTMQTMRVS